MELAKVCADQSQLQTALEHISKVWRKVHVTLDKILDIILYHMSGTEIGQQVRVERATTVAGGAAAAEVTALLHSPLSSTAGNTDTRTGRPMNTHTHNVTATCDTYMYVHVG